MTIYAAASGEYESLHYPMGAPSHSTTSSNFDSTAADAAVSTATTYAAAQLVMPSAIATGWLHFHLFMNNFGAGDSGALITFRSSATAGELRIRASGSGATSNVIYMQVDKTTNGTTWTQLGTATFGLQYNVTARWDVQVNLASSGGYVRIYRNGFLLFEFTGDTSTQTNTFDRVEFGGTRESTDPRFSEIVLASVNTIDWKMQTQKPNGAGNYTAWTGAYTTIDETTYDDGDYTYSNVNNDKFSYNFENTSSTVQGGREVKALVAQAAVFIPPTSTPGDMRYFLRISSTDYETSDLNLTADGAYNRATYIWETSPATSAAWATAAIDSAEVGFKAVA